MKKYLFFLLLLFSSRVSPAQRPQKMRTLWTVPQVHVFFGRYRVSFAIRDINKALDLLRKAGDSTHRPNCGLDTNINYTYELYPGEHTQYRSDVEPLLQNIVGAYLLSQGMAEIESRTKKRIKKLESVLVDMRYIALEGNKVTVEFYDPDTKAMLFSGDMPMALYKADIGIDDW